MRGYLHDERGAITIDTAVIFLPMMAMVLVVIEICIAFYFVLSAQKAAKYGARYAVSESPIHTGVPRTNKHDTDVGKFFACFQDPDPSPCLDPGGPWLCDGSTYSGDANCVDARFEALVNAMRVVYPALPTENVSIQYSYVQLGYANGPFTPHVEVVVKSRRSPLGIKTMLTGVENLPLREVGASAFVGDLNTDNNNDTLFK